MASSSIVIGRLEAFDIAVIVIYFVVVIGFALWVSAFTVYHTATDAYHSRPTLSSHCCALALYMRSHTVSTRL